MEKQMAHMPQFLKTSTRSPRKPKGPSEGSKALVASNDPILAVPRPYNGNDTKTKGRRGNGGKGKKGATDKGKSPRYGSGPFADFMHRVRPNVLHKDNLTAPGFCHSDTCTYQACNGEECSLRLSHL